MSEQNGQSVQSDLLDLVVTTMGGAQANVFRCRFSDFAIAELPADNLIPQDEPLDYEDTDDIERKFQFHVRHLVAASDGTDKAADLRYVRAAKLLLADVTLDGAVKRIKELGRKWEMEKSELPIMALVVTYEIEFSTLLRDPSAPGY